MTHLELQWAMFIPLSLWAVHRTMELGRWRYGLLAGLFVWLQFLSCVYYGVFLGLALIVFVPLLLTFKGHVPVKRFVPPLLCGGALALALPFRTPGRISRRHEPWGRDQPMRSPATARSRSATLASPTFNRIWGWTANSWGAPELRLFPGLIALLLGVAAIGHPRRRMVPLYAATMFVVVQLSFGLNGTVYRVLLGHVSSLQGFRALARFGNLVGCTVAILAAMGTQVLMARLSLGTRGRRAFVGAVIALLIVEYSNRPLPLSQPVNAEPSDVYKVLRRAEPGPIAELPLPQPDTLPGWDPDPRRGRCGTGVRCSTVTAASIRPNTSRHSGTSKIFPIAAQSQPFANETSAT